MNWLGRTDGFFSRIDHAEYSGSRDDPDIIDYVDSIAEALKNMPASGSLLALWITLNQKQEGEISLEEYHKKIAELTEDYRVNNPPVDTPIRNTLPLNMSEMGFKKYYNYIVNTDNFDEYYSNENLEKTVRGCSYVHRYSPRKPEKSQLFSGRCIENPRANWDYGVHPPHANAFVSGGNRTQFLDTDEEVIVTDDTEADNDCRDQCMVYATVNILTDHFVTPDPGLNALIKKNKEQGDLLENEPFFAGFGLVARIKQSSVFRGGSRMEAATMSENVYENLLSRGYFGSFSPWAELTCPMEVTFGDDRSQSMSYKQQLENVYASSVSMIGDIPVTTEALGRGCYMCVKAKEGLYDTLKNTPSWMQHYDEKACSIESIVPVMENVPYFADKLETESYQSELHKYGRDGDILNIYNRLQWRDDNFYKNSEGFTRAPPKDGQKLNNFNFDAFKLYRPFRTGEHFKSVGGVYTLYPYVKLPALSENADEDKQHRWEDLITKQLDYMYNPAWHVTVEVTGMSKAKGRPVLRNFHGKSL